MDQVIGVMLAVIAIGLIADRILFSPWERDQPGNSLRQGYGYAPAAALSWERQHHEYRGLYGYEPRAVQVLVALS